MRWSRAAVVLGSLVLVACFCLATDTPISADVGGRQHRCAAVLDPGTLVSGQPAAETAVPDGRTPAERRLDAQVEAECAPLERLAQWATWGGIGLGGMVLLTGWTALREREHDEQVSALRAHGQACA